MHVYLFGVLYYFDVTVLQKISSQESVHLFIILLLAFQEVRQKKQRQKFLGVAFDLFCCEQCMLLWGSLKWKTAYFSELWTFIFWFCNWIQLLSSLEQLVHIFSHNGKGWEVGILIMNRQTFEGKLKAFSVGIINLALRVFSTASILLSSFALQKLQLSKGGWIFFFFALQV